MKNYGTFEFLKKMAFVRTGGSKEEYQCSLLLKEECEKMGVDTVIEEFDVDGFEILGASLSTINPGKEYDACGVGMSGSTPDEGITGNFKYVTSLVDAQYSDLEGCICLIHTKNMNPKIYQVLVEKKVAGIIMCCGSVYLDASEVDLDPYQYRERVLKHGKIPAVCIRMKDAEELIKSNPEKVHLFVKQNEFPVKSHNVVATIEGTNKKDEIICFTAHYDSVSYSQGVYDNATGSVCILELLKYYKENRPQRTLKFIWCGSEEMGLLGSKAYTQIHKDELSSYQLCINVDMVGVTIGSDIACCTTNKSLVSYLKYLSSEIGFPLEARQGVYSSDSTPFADCGVPALSFARISARGGSEIHSRRDVIDYLEPNNYYRTCNFIETFADRMISSYKVPVERDIPQNMKDEIDYYYGRKERNND